jgi:hypothetical protein
MSQRTDTTLLQFAVPVDPKSIVPTFQKGSGTQVLWGTTNPWLTGKGETPMEVRLLEPPKGDDEHESYVSVYQPVRGWTAVIYHYNTTEDFLEEGEGFWEPWQTGILSFATREEAVRDGKRWAEDEGIAFKDGK